MEIGDKKDESAAYGNLGTNFYSLGKHQDAIKYQKMRLSIVLEIGDKKGASVAYGHLGAVYHSLGNYQVAIKY